MIAQLMSGHFFGAVSDAEELLAFAEAAFDEVEPSVKVLVERVVPCIRGIAVDRQRAFQ
jgi:hypothetical protein